MLSISEYIFEKLKLNASSRIIETIKSYDFANFLLENISKFGSFKDISKVTKGDNFKVGSCYYIMHENKVKPFFIFMWHIHRYIDTNENKIYFTNIMLSSGENNDEKIHIYYIVTVSDYYDQNNGKTVSVVDFYDPDISLKETKETTPFKLNNLDQFGEMFIKMLNDIHDCKTSQGRLNNFKEYAKKMKKYLS